MINRHLMKPRMTTATVIGTLGTAAADECAGDNHHVPMVMAHSTIHASVMALAPGSEGALCAIVEVIDFTSSRRADRR